MRLFLAMSDDEAAGYASALRRLRDVERVSVIDGADAVVGAAADVAQVAGRPWLWFPAADASGDLPDGDHVTPAAHWRFRPSIQVVVEALRSGKLGAPGLLRVHRWAMDLSWVGELDLACWFFGASPDTIYGVERPGYVQVHLGFSGGGMAVIDHAEGLGEGGDRYESLSLIGADGAVYADDHRNVHLLLKSEGCQGLTRCDGDASRAALLADFVGGLRSGRTAERAREDYRRACEAAARLAESVRVGGAA